MVAVLDPYPGRSGLELQGVGKVVRWDGDLVGLVATSGAVGLIVGTQFGKNCGHCIVEVGAEEVACDEKYLIC